MERVVNRKYWKKIDTIREYREWFGKAEESENGYNKRIERVVTTEKLKCQKIDIIKE